MIAAGTPGPGESLPAERKLAEQIGVSRPTIRAVVLNLEKEGIIQTVGKRGRMVSLQHKIPPAFSLFKDTVLLITGRALTEQDLNLQQTSAEVFVNIGVMNAINEHNFVSMMVTPEQLKEKVELFTGNPPAGIIIFSRACTKELEEVLNPLSESIHIIGAGIHPLLQTFDSAFSDQEKGACLLTKKLIEMGKTRIQRIWSQNLEAGEVDLPVWFEDRNRGYLRAIAEAGLEPLPVFKILESPISAHGAERFNISVRHTAGYLLPLFNDKENRPDALLCASDGRAIRIAEACRLIGVDPDKAITIAGYDNHWRFAGGSTASNFIPHLTIDKHNQKIGETAFQLLKERIAGILPEEVQSRKISPKLVFPGQAIHSISIHEQKES